MQCDAAGRAALKLQPLWRDGTTYLVMSPLGFSSRRRVPIAWLGCTMAARAIRDRAGLFVESSFAMIAGPSR